MIALGSVGTGAAKAADVPFPQPQVQRPPDYYAPPPVADAYPPPAVYGYPPPPTVYYEYAPPIVVGPRPYYFGRRFVYGPYPRWGYGPYLARGYGWGRGYRRW
jgi:hypothetical protein